uniref:Endonuclease/exonuclease/phosphatase family protein n=1 Tax=Roseihalotalea indica TaxID=2867963 RepID=A0AA49GMT8_9BACT|nr:endonuclease/exonuclease/phosphatase family protein [Tunicatimonas sp. TK19036]
MGFTEPSTHLKVMSFNIRYDNPGDGEHAWDHRKDRVINLIHFYQPDIFGLQEAVHHQVTYVEDHFPDYKRVGVGRDDGKQKGEYSPLFFNASAFEMIDSGTFWLSTTPDKPSKDWDAALPRIATWALLRRTNTNDTLLACNTHFDHRGEKARVESAKLLKSKLPQLAQKHPLILTGDFNSTPTSDPYKTLAGGNTLKDAYKQSEITAVGPYRSFGGFEVVADGQGERIDYIFVSDKIKVHRYATITEEQDGSYPSDHFPVFAEISW